MAIRVAIKHNTEYQFDRLVMLSPHVIRLRPAPSCRTPIDTYTLKVQPDDNFMNWQQDPFGNYLARVVFPEKSEFLKIDVDLIAEMIEINPFDFFLEETAERFPFDYEKQLKRDLLPYLEIREDGPNLKSWIASIDRTEQPTVNFLVGLNQTIQRQIKYLTRMEPGVQSCEETLTSGIGSCRDSAWLLMQVLRHLGLATRFVSGYLVQLKSEANELKQDFSDLHAWAEVFLPGAGWVGLDTTSGFFAGEGHIPLASTPDPSSAAPILGTTEKCNTKFSFSMDVKRID